jgi:hypothetical protein
MSQDRSEAVNERQQCGCIGRSDPHPKMGDCAAAAAAAEEKNISCTNDLISCKGGELVLDSTALSLEVASKTPVLANQVVAHRGYHSKFEDQGRPIENTLGAFQAVSWVVHRAI